MNKIVQCTSRGQITLPKKWRDQFETRYFQIEIENNTLILNPLLPDKIGSSVEEAWQEYLDGKYVTEEELMKKYGL